MSDLLVANQLAQPPTFELQFFDADRQVGWVSAGAVGFLGFENEEEAMHAAYLAHRTLSHRLAHRYGIRPVPVTTEPLTLEADGTLFAARRHIGTIIRPGPDGKSGASFGFELPFPTPLEEVAARSKCAQVYRALRRSGIRWAMWRAEQPAGLVAPLRPGSPTADEAAVPRRNPKSATAEPIPWWLSVFTLSVVLLLAAAVVSSERVAPALAGIGLAGLMLVRLYAMTPRWPLRPARQGFVIRRSQGDLDRSSL